MTFPFSEDSKEQATSIQSYSIWTILVALIGTVENVARALCLSFMFFILLVFALVFSFLKELGEAGTVLSVSGLLSAHQKWWPYNSPVEVTSEEKPSTSEEPSARKDGNEE